MRVLYSFFYVNFKTQPPVSPFSKGDFLQCRAPALWQAFDTGLRPFGAIPLFHLYCRAPAFLQAFNTGLRPFGAIPLFCLHCREKQRFNSPLAKGVPAASRRGCFYKPLRPCLPAMLSAKNPAGRPATRRPVPPRWRSSAPRHRASAPARILPGCTQGPRPQSSPPHPAAAG